MAQEVTTSKEKRTEEAQKPATVKEPEEKKPVKKKGKKRRLDEGVFYLYAGLNNTVITLADKEGNVVASSSAGQAGFKGSRKSTPFAASKAARLILEKAQSLGVTSASIVVKGVSVGRDATLRALGGSEIQIVSLRDVTPLPHNGPRPKRSRRV